MIAIAVSSNRATLGKIGQGDVGAWRIFNGSFENVSVTPEEFLRLVANGYAYTTQHSNNWRHSRNFVCGQHLGLDLDNLGLSLEQIANIPFFRKFASFAHTTPSHTEENPRLRVVFVLDRPIPHPAKFAELSESLVERFGATDQSVKDPARFFYGAMGCLSHWWGNILSLEDAATELVIPARRIKEQAKAASLEASRNRIVLPAEGVSPRLLEVHSGKLLERVRSAPDGEKYITLRNVAITFGGYIGGGYYNREDVTNWLQAAIQANPNNVKDVESAYQTIEKSINYGLSRPLVFESTPLNHEPRTHRDYPELDVVQPPLTTEQRAVVAKIIQEKQWVAYHEGMTAGERARWEAMGIPPAFQDLWQLGYTDSAAASRGSPGALTVPFFAPGWQFDNMEYRPVGGSSRDAIYQIDAPSVWLASPDEMPAGNCLLFSDTACGAISYVELVAKAGHGIRVAAIPQFDTTRDKLSIFEECDTLSVMTDPGNADGAAAIISMLKRELGKIKIKIVHLPDSADRLMKLYKFSPATMMNYVAQGTVA